MVDTLAYLERFIDAVTCSMTPEAAQAVLDFRVDDATQAELDDLADKANRGTLTEKERETYAQFIEFSDLIGIAQARARRAISQPSIR